MIPELAAQAQPNPFSALNLMGKRRSTIVLKKVKSPMFQFKTGLAHKKKTNVQLRKMFLSLPPMMENGLLRISHGVKINQLQWQKLPTGTANIKSSPPRRPVI